MVKFTILFNKPRDSAAFENLYQNFLALIERMPDVQRRQVNHVLGSPMGEARLYRILEVYFADSPTMEAALRSKAGQEAGRELMMFPQGTFETFFIDVYEEAGGHTEQ